MHNISIDNFIGNAITEHVLRRVEGSKISHCVRNDSQMLRMARKDKKITHNRVIFLTLIATIYPIASRRMCPTTANTNNS